MAAQMTEQELMNCFDDAINYNHIYAVYQPQVNHSTGRMVGAEALMRWKHPLHGMQYPSDFIPVLEKNNLIFRADLHIFELVCKLQKKCLDQGISIVPISVNMSRYDIYNNDYVDAIEKIRKQYNVPVKYLRIEITESSAIGGMALVSKVLDQFHEYGYMVEMDDFGSGYSSLNILKDLNIDIIKLDMNFISGGIGGRGGTILSSVVRMAKWLNTPVIAEGVETMEIADYMRSIGCNYIQGYLYSKPIEEAAYIEMLGQLNHEPLEDSLKLLNTIDSGKFWDPDSMETLIFSNFVGPAAIFSFDTADEKVELLRVNQKYIKEIGMGRTEKQLISANPWDNLNEENKQKYIEKIKKAIVSNDEEVSEHWRDICTEKCGDERICVRSEIRVIGSSGTRYLIYAMIHNITKEKQNMDSLIESEGRFKYAFEQANVYAWEVDLTTMEMRPCFRCMRDLNLPPLVKNYPESAIEAGIFPPDYADMYRDWMKQLADGVDNIEGIIPLTVGRVPFHVRYTLQYDENHKPLKAYGSATLVVDPNKNSDKNRES